MGSNDSQNPKHVAIIMDGNGRWAAERGLPRIEGHRKGADSVKEIVRVAADLGISYITLYAFSAENRQRPRDEIDGLMEMLEQFLRDQTNELVKREVRFRTIGRIEDLPQSVQAEIQRTLDATASFNKWHLTLALNYGSRIEIVDAAKAYAEAVADGRENPGDCNWDVLKKYLNTTALPDPDLIIRTSGETRLSNFLLLQSAYSELFFSTVLWPDFREQEFVRAIEDYRRRERRFGRTSEQIKEENLRLSLNPQ